MFLSVDNNSCNLLIHENQNGRQQCRNNGRNTGPNRIGPKQGYGPTPTRPRGSELIGYCQFRRLHSRQIVQQSHTHYGNYNGKIRNKASASICEETLEFEGLQVPRNKESANKK